MGAFLLYHIGIYVFTKQKKIKIWVPEYLKQSKTSRHAIFNVASECTRAYVLFINFLDKK